MNPFHAPTMNIPGGPWTSNTQVIQSVIKTPVTEYECDGNSQLTETELLSAMSGRMTYLRMDDQCIAQIMDIVLEEEVHEKAETDGGWVGFQFALSGDQVSVVDGYGQVNSTGPRFNVCATCHPTRVAKFYYNSSAISAVNIIVKPDYLIRNYGLHKTTLPLPVRAIFEGKQNVFYSSSQPLTPVMSNAITSLVKNQMKGQMRETFLRAKITELLCLACESLSQQCNESNNRLKLTDRDIKLLHKVREEVRENFAAPPPLSEISRNIGLNRNKLSWGFKHLFGSGVYEYCQQYRMQKAKLMLKESKLSILEVAIEVGFQNQSSFSRAYKDFFSRAPSQDRL